MASLPFFNSINTDGSSKEQIVENLMKENMIFSNIGEINHRKLLGFTRD
jgi:hypothetical protein